MTRRRSKKNKTKNTRIIWGLFLIAAIIKVAMDLKAQEDEQASTPGHIVVEGSLTEVKTNPKLAEVEKDYTGMTVSFNPRLHVPNWVAWELTAEETKGKTPRYNKFQADEDMEGSADPWDYNYSGYDRGHMAPAGDMKWSEEAMRETFYMTNMCPQAKNLNTGAWKSLEEKCRQWAKADSAIVIVCGPVLTDSITEYIGDSRVAVPERFFKVVLSPYANPPRGIGFVMNNGRVDGGIQRAAMSIDEVERITGHDFFAALPDSIENIIESQNDFHVWSTLR